MKRIAVAFDECGTEIFIEMGKSETLDTLRERHPECSFRYIKTESIDYWHDRNTGDQDDYGY